MTDDIEAIRADIVKGSLPILPIHSFSEQQAMYNARSRCVRYAQDLLVEVERLNGIAKDLFDEVQRLTSRLKIVSDTADRRRTHVSDLQVQVEELRYKNQVLRNQRDAAIQKLQMYLFAISEGAFTMTEDWLVSDFKGLLHILGAPE